MLENMKQLATSTQQRLVLRLSAFGADRETMVKARAMKLYTPGCYLLSVRNPRTTQIQESSGWLCE